MKSNKKIIGIILLLVILLGVNSCFLRETLASAYGSRMYCGIKNLKGQTQDSWANNILLGEGKSITENNITYYWSLSEFLKSGGNNGNADSSKGWVEKNEYKKTGYEIVDGIIAVIIDGNRIHCTTNGKIIDNNQEHYRELDIDKILIYQRGYLGIQVRNVGDLEFREDENWKSDITQGNGKKVLEDGVTYYFSSNEFLAQQQLGSSRVRGWIVYNEDSYKTSAELDSGIEKTSDGYIRNVDNVKIYYDNDFNYLDKKNNSQIEKESNNSKNNLKSVASVEKINEKSINISHDAYELYIRDLYTRALKRDCTEEELQNSLGKSIYDTTIDILLSKESYENNAMSTNKEFVVICYNVLFNSSGEESGITNHEAWLNAGNTREDLIRKLINGDEFSKIKVIPEYERTVKINRDNVALRAKAEEEIAKIEDPEEKQKAIEKAERLERLSKMNLVQDDVLKKYFKVIIQELYQKDSVSDEEIEKWLNIHKDGYDIEDILKQIIDTDECIDYINGLDDEDFVNKAYVIFTYQVPNEHNKNIALDYIKSETKEEWLTKKLLISPEFSSLKYKLIKNNFNFEVLKQDEYNPKIGTDKKGDINGDDMIDARDASMLLTIVSDIAVSEEDKYMDYKDALDIDGSGAVTTHDAVIVLKYYAVSSTGYNGSLDEYLNSDLYRNSDIYNSNE